MPSPAGFGPEGAVLVPDLSASLGQGRQAVDDGMVMIAGQVRRRRVFYIPGYDPFHPRRYRELYRKEGRAQAAISGYTLRVSARTGEGGCGWQVAAEIEGAAVESEVEVLVWSDLVQHSMRQGVLATYVQLARTVWAYVGSGAFFGLMRLRKGPMIAALYPVGMLLAELGVAVLAGWILAGAAGWAMAGLGLAPLAILALQAAFAVLVVWLVLERFRLWDKRLYAWYLMHDYAFTALAGGAYPPVLEARLAEFAARIGAALRAGGDDEVLVVGHSSGAHLGVSILADLLRSGQGGAKGSGPALGFLSLGHVVPMVSFLPRAGRLRADLAYLSREERLTWVDVTAPGDGCAFALCDPVSVSGVAPPDKRWPLVISAAFTHTLSPETWKSLRWRFFRLHFQYLCAFDRPGDYDYFRITAGPRTLAARYAGRAPSKSRIETPIRRWRAEP